jgi:hypothetical protein
MTYSDSTIVSKLRWRLIKKVQQVLLKNNALIFGGFVRDLLLHNHAARRYYESCDVMGVDPDAHYTDFEFLPHLKQRMLIPNDIDCMMTLSQYESFKKEIKKKKIHILEDVYQNVSRYRTHPKSKCYCEHIRSYVSVPIPELLKGVLPKISFSMDVMCYYSESIPSLDSLSTPDFGCNGLLLTSLGLQLSPKVAESSDQFDDPIHKLDMLNSIVKDLLQKKTIFVKPNVEIHRIKKLIQKGWKLCGDFMELERAGQTYEGHCLLCHENFDNEISAKFACCDGRYHLSCFKEVLEDTSPHSILATSKCPMCRKDKTYRSFSDLHIIKHLCQSGLSDLEK